jgi:hypothetical protein
VKDLSKVRFRAEELKELELPVDSEGKCGIDIVKTKNSQLGSDELAL